MPPKRKVPLARADANALAPAARKTTKGKRAAEAGPAAVEKKWKYSNPSTMANQGPVDVIFFMWPRSGDNEEDIENDDGQDDNPEPGSLQEILDGLANERSKAVHEALNPPEELINGCRIIHSQEARRRIDEASKPFYEKMDEARQKFVDAGTMTAEQAKAKVGVNDEDRKEKRRVKKRVQDRLNEIQTELKKAVHEALNSGGVTCMTVAEGRARIAKTEKPFQEKMEKVREAATKYSPLTAEEVNAIVPNIELDDEGNEIIKKSATQIRKEAEEAAFVPPRIVNEEGFPVSKAGMEKFIEINQEVEKRDQDIHGMHMFNDFSGYGVTEVMENMLAEFNRLIFKKDVSPIKKWALVEGITLYLAMDDHMIWMMNDDWEGMGEVFDILGVMFITALEMLRESGLIGPTSPVPDNIGVMILYFLDFIINTCSDYDMEWVNEIVRAADKYGVALTPVTHIEGVDQDKLDELRDECEETKMKKGLAWKTQFPKFKRNHPGGHKYDITKMSKAKKDQYMVGNMSEDSD